MADTKSTELKSQEIVTVTDMHRALQEEIQAVKDGALSESTAKVVFAGRKLQLQNVALNLQFLRMYKGGQAPTGELRLQQTKPSPVERVHETKPDGSAEAAKSDDNNQH